MSQPPAADAEPRLDPRAFRNTIGQFATGVTIVAAMHGDHMHAMTANSITSLSLDPPLVIFCLGKSAHMVVELRQADGFSINILRENQQPLSSYFAGRWSEPVPPHFRFVPWEGGPRLEGCTAALGCVIHDWLDGGDHFIVLGKVIALYRDPEPGRPLLFYAGTYRYLDAEEQPAPEIDEDVMPIQIFYDPW
jgi:flavin reductase (DIM6/NTAB) family NADH-FMN oxidoreductase RutF